MHIKFDKMEAKSKAFQIEKERELHFEQRNNDFLNVALRNILRTVQDES